MLQNAYFRAKIGADTAENEQHFAEILPTDALVNAGQPEPRVLDPEDPTHACGMPRRVERLLERGEEVCNDHL